MKKDAAVIKALTELGDVPEVELSADEEHQFKYATDEEYRYLYDIEDIFNNSKE